MQSLHVIFTLYAEFKANQHFQAVPGDAGDVLVARKTSPTPLPLALSN